MSDPPSTLPSRPASRAHHGVPPSRAFSELGDFTADKRLLRITLLAVPVGAAAAVVSWALLRLIGLITNLVFFGRVDTRLVAPDTGHHAWPVVIAAPVVGGLVIGLMARYGSEKIRGHGMPEAIESILTGGSRVQPRVAVLKPVSAAIAIGTGGPFGAEGPIIMTGGAVGSLLAQLLKLTADERKTLLVAGAAGGMAATFNSPFAAVILAVELLLFEWRPRSYVPVATAVAVATVIRGYLLGTAPVFGVPHVSLHFTAVVYGLCVATGLSAGVLALIATLLVYAAEDAFTRLPVHWMWWPAIGGLIIGIGGLIVPQALGVGYDVIDAELIGHASIGLVLGILIVKTLIWSLSLGSGTSGGVLAPMFMVGGALGALEATIFPHVAPGFWALIALAGVLGGVMRSPLTGVVFAIELTHRYDAILPLLISASAAYAFSVLVLKRSVLTEKIARRGYHLTREYDIDPLEVLFVREVMTTDVVTFTPQDRLDDVLTTFLDARKQARDLQHRQRLYPVLDENGAPLGALTRRDALDLALQSETVGGTVADVMTTQLVVVYPDDTLRHVAYRMAHSGVTRTPVLDRETGQLVGLVSLAQLLEGRLKDLREARDAERVLRFRPLRTLGPGRVVARTERISTSG